MVLGWIYKDSWDFQPIQLKKQGMPRGSIHVNTDSGMFRKWYV